MYLCHAFQKKNLFTPCYILGCLLTFYVVSKYIPPGQKTEDELGIETIVVNYFSRIFQTQAQFSSINDLLITKQLFEEDVRILSMPSAEGLGTGWNTYLLFSKDSGMLLGTMLRSLR